MTSQDWLLNGLGLAMAAAVAVMALAAHQAQDAAVRQLFLTAHLAGSIVFLCTFLFLRKQPDDRSFFWSILGWALLYRAILLPTPPILEDDIYRYLWDGKVLAHGFNPYEFTPEEVLGFRDNGIKSAPGEETGRRGRLEAVASLAQPGAASECSFEPILRKVNYKHVPTVYPPLTEFFFALAYWIRPGSLLTVKSLVVLWELMALGVTCLLLSHLRLKRTYIVIPAWSPLGIKEFANSGHHDSLALFFVVLGVYGVIKERKVLAGCAFGLATLAKLYPAALVLLFSRKLGWKGVFSAAAVAFLGYLPFAAAGWKIWSGVSTFATQWQFNGGAFALVRTAAWWVCKEVRGDPEGCYQFGVTAGRVICGGLAGALLFTLTVHPRAQSMPATLAAPLFLAFSFLLSPVINPWYLAVLLPFLCFHPLRSLLWLTLAVSLSYLHGGDFTVPNWVRMIEYLPVVGLLAWDLADTGRWGHKRAA